jgi:hypothetical protein
VKAVAGVLPWAAVSAVVGGVIWWLLSGEIAAGRWLLAAVLIGHAIVHIFFAVPAPAAEGGTEWPFDMAKSWTVIRAGVPPRTVRNVGIALIAIVVAGSALAALATVGIVVPAAWWRATVAVSAVASAALLVLVFAPQLVLGLAIDAVLLWLVVAGVWMP